MEVPKGGPRGKPDPTSLLSRSAPYSTYSCGRQAGGRQADEQGPAENWVGNMTMARTLEATASCSSSRVRCTGRMDYKADKHGLFSLVQR